MASVRLAVYFCDNAVYRRPSRASLLCRLLYIEVHAMHVLLLCFTNFPFIQKQAHAHLIPMCDSIPPVKVDGTAVRGRAGRARKHQAPRGKERQASDSKLRPALCAAPAELLLPYPPIPTEIISG